MNHAILHLPYFPNIYWMCQFLKHEPVLIEREENFIKSTFRNRCEITGANGLQLLSIPLRGGRDNHSLYKEVRIDYTTQWNKKHWQSIRSCYGSAPFFEYYAYKLQPLYHQQFEFLFQFNSQLLAVLLQLLKIEKTYAFTTSYQKHPPGFIDLRIQKETTSTLLYQFQFTPYYQVFESRNGFMPNLSIIDLIFNLGTEAKDYLYAQRFS